MNRNVSRRAKAKTARPGPPRVAAAQAHDLGTARQEAELRKLHAESSKFEAEAAKLRRESRYMPWAAGLTAVGTFLGGAFVVLKSFI